MISLQLKDRTISTSRPAFVMGIINATPDSFFDKSRGSLELAKKLIDDGADILDIGGESTRPGFSPVSAQEQIDRIIPLIKEIRTFSDIPISIDTRSAQVIKAAVENGADILNDVSSLEDDSEITDLAAKLEIPVILMHGFMENEENRPSDPDVIENVRNYLLQRADFALSKGIAKDKIILDPGIGFGKTGEENIALIKNIGQLCGLGYPVLMALSRKRDIGSMTERTVEDRLIGTVTADIYSVMQGAKLIRVHDVKEAIDSLNVMKYLF